MTGPVRQQAMRENNLGVVLRSIAEHGAVSRAAIAAATGLTKATVSSLVDELDRAGLVADGGAVGNVVGRPGQAVRLNPDGPVGVGLEINIDYLVCCVVDLAGHQRHLEVRLADNRTRPHGEVLDEAAELLAQGMRAAGRQPVAGLVAAVPGLVTAQRGALVAAPNLDWPELEVAEELTRRIGRSSPVVSVQNEANLAALGEFWFGGKPELADFIHVSGEIGIGAGVVVAGELFRGRHGFAGELGHVMVSVDGERCRCGALGCLEQVAGQEAILRAAGLPTTTGTSLGTPEGPLAQLVELARAGQSAAVSAIEQAGAALGVALAGMVNVLDPAAVVLGGMFAQLAPWLAGPVRAELDRRVLGARWTDLRVEVSRLGWEAAVRGAAGSVTRAIVRDPAEYLRGRTADIVAPWHCG